MSAELTTLRVRVEGNVQGVGFRAFAVRVATALNLKGWTRNLKDGAMEAMVTGEVKDVEKFIQACMKGPAGAKVNNIDLQADADTGGEGFIVLPDA
jgi:acylphosphatase